ncbi:Uncharacterised protein [Burkholderia pseudomallei]|nr:Uncharacterised protein [Burkholderia pseudomallei]
MPPGIRPNQYAGHRHRSGRRNHRDHQAESARSDTGDQQLHVRRRRDERALGAHSSRLVGHPAGVDVDLHERPQSRPEQRPHLGRDGHRRAGGPELRNTHSRRDHVDAALGHPRAMSELLPAIDRRRLQALRAESHVVHELRARRRQALRQRQLRRKDRRVGNLERAELRPELHSSRSGPLYAAREERIPGDQAGQSVGVRLCGRQLGVPHVAEQRHRRAAVERRGRPRELDGRPLPRAHAVGAARLAGRDVRERRARVFRRTRAPSPLPQRRLARGASRRRTTAPARCRRAAWPAS